MLREICTPEKPFTQQCQYSKEQHLKFMTQHRSANIMTSSNENILALLALCGGNPPVTGGFPLHKSQWRGALMIYLICSWTNGWASNRKAGDLTLSRSLLRHCDENEQFWCASFSLCKVTVVRNWSHDEVNTWKRIPYNWPFEMGFPSEKWSEVRRVEQMVKHSRVASDLRIHVALMTSW